MIFKNLRLCFPDKSEKEIKQIAKDFYRNFADILIESIKGFTISEKEMRKRYQVLNVEVLDKYYHEGKSVVSVAAHYTNWEWGIAIGKETKHKANTIYKPLSNKYLDTYLKKKRERFGMNLISMKQTGRAFIGAKEPVSVLLIADQNPNPITAIWVDFLGQDTACIHGPEAFAKKLKLPVVFYKYNRVKRGFYTLEIVNISDSQESIEHGFITKKYMSVLEKAIKENKGNWLWSHKRWKHIRENGEIVHSKNYQF